MTKVLMRTVLLAIAAAAALAIASPRAQSKFTLKVHTGRGQTGYDVNSTMISGEKTGWPARQKFWFATYGSNIPGPDPGRAFQCDGPAGDGPHGRTWWRNSIRNRSARTSKSCGLCCCLLGSSHKNRPHIAHAQKAIERIVKASHVEFRGHDLRRTAASLMVGAGVPRLVVSKILNHVETGVTAVYDRHSYDLEKRAALEFWGRRLEAIVANGKSAKILRFQATAWQDHRAAARTIAAVAFRIRRNVKHELLRG